jgi:hypothetical protein
MAEQVSRKDDLDADEGELVFPDARSESCSENKGYDRVSKQGEILDKKSFWKPD